MINRKDDFSKNKLSSNYFHTEEYFRNVENGNRIKKK